jgi:glycolate oxidase
MAFTEVAYKALQDIVGEDNVTNEPAMCQAYSRVQWLPSGVMQREQCGLNMRPTCVVMPGSAEEAQSVIKVAKRYKFPFIPRGSGFTNQAFPTQAGTMVIDPKRMDRIIELNEKDMYAVIEPYVAFVQLFAEAQKYGLYVPTPLAGSQVSCLANFSWHGAYGNSWITGIGAQNLLGFELVLPDGELVRSGSMACPEAGNFWNDGPGPDLRGFLRAGAFGHAGGMGFVTKISCKLWPWAGPEVFPTEGNANMKFSSSLGDLWRWYMIKFPFKYPEEEEKELRASAELFYEMGKAEIGEVATHLAQQFLYTYSSVTKEDLFENMKNNVFPSGFCVVALAGKTSLEQLEYEEKVLQGIVKKVGGIFVEEDEPAYQTWIKRAANEWIRFGNAQRLARPSDNFSIGSSNIDSIDQIVYEIRESNELGRDLLREKGLGKDFVQPLSVQGGWISPQEYGHWCLHTTDVFPEQDPAQCNQALEIIGNVVKSQFERNSSSKTLHMLGIAYDMFGPMIGNVHLIVKGLKREFDPDNLSNPGYAATPDVLSEEEWKKMMGL